MNKTSLKDFLEKKVDQYNQPFFIKDDPVCIPHLFSKKQDIEIAGFFAAVFAWGNRTTIINKSKELLQLMEMQPHEFCLNHDQKELKRLTGFKHRTFNDTDLLYFVEFFKHHYGKHKSLEPAFAMHGYTIEKMLTGFHHYFFSLDHVPHRTRKHIANPDFGIWKKITPAQLICPIDLHVARVAKRFNLLHRKQIDWLAAVELTDYLRTLDENDPVKYDFALFGMGVIDKF